MERRREYGPLQLRRAPTQDLPRPRRLHRQLPQVTHAASLQDVDEASDLPGDVDNKQEATVRKSDRPTGSRGPHLGV